MHSTGRYSFSGWNSVVEGKLIEFIIELHHFICISQANYAKIDRNNNGDATIVCVTLDEMWPFGHWQQETPEANTCKLARPCIMKHKLAPGKQQKLQSSKSKTQTRRKLNYKKKRTKKQAQCTAQMQHPQQQQQHRWQQQ